MASLKKYIKFFKDTSGVKIWVEKVNSKFWVHFKGRNFIFSPYSSNKNQAKEKKSLPYLLAPYPGRILSIKVKEGHLVQKDQPLIVLESMKIEHTLTAPQDVKVKSILVQVGQSVGYHEKLILF